MRVAIYNPFWDTLGGGERYAASVAKLLLKRGDEVDIWWTNNLTRPILDKFGIDIGRANFVSRKSTLKYDLLFWVSDGSLPTSLAKKTIIHFQFPFTEVGGKSWKNRLKSHFYTFVVNSQFTKQFVDSEFGIDSLVVYPPVSVDQIKPAKKENIILYVGRFSNLTQQKGHETLVRVFKKIYPDVSGWKMVLAGGSGVGTDQAEMRRLVSLIGKYPIDLVTDLSWPQLKKLYGKSKIYFSASGYGVDQLKHPLMVEHFGITAVEAMAAGCVPVVVDAGGHREIVSSNFGYLWQDLNQAQEWLIKLCNEEAQIQLWGDRARKQSQKYAYNVFEKNFLSLL